MHQYSRWLGILGKFLLGVLICSTAVAAGPQRLKSLDHLDQIITSAGYGSNSAIILFQPEDFENPKEAKQIEDAIALARSWNIWFSKHGQVVLDLRDKMNFVAARRVSARIDDRTRADLMFEWLWVRIEATPYLSPEVLDELEARIPVALAAFKPAISFVIEAKRSGNMRNMYSSPRARLHAFRQQNLGLRVITSCETNVSKPGSAEPSEDL